MILVCFSKDDHVICYPSYSWYAEENHVEVFTGTHPVLHDGTHWKSGPLEPSNV